MLNRLRKSNKEGFTIIEVMIVLAIAGLIILIVLLAVPALQRNSRNTAIKNDASAIAGGITEFSSNNDGLVPDTITASNGTVTLKNAAVTTSSDSTAKIQGNTTVKADITAKPAAGKPDPGELEIWKKHNCAGTSSSRAYAIFYTVETSGTPAQKCLDT